MSNKQEAVKNLKNAKTAHLLWRARAQALVAGVEMNGEQVPIGDHDCQFGKWYYGTGYAALGSLATFHALEIPHKTLHAVYSKIFDALDANRTDDRSTLRKLFGKASHNKQDEIKELVNNMIEVSKTLLMAIKHLEEDLAIMSDEEFDALQGIQKESTTTIKDPTSRDSYALA